jgi:hypothetical protein
VDITVRMAIALLVCASVVLLGLFALIKLGVSIVMVITVMFCVGATSAVSMLVVHPVLSLVAPNWNHRFLNVGVGGRAGVWDG